MGCLQVRMKSLTCGSYCLTRFIARLEQGADIARLKLQLLER